MAPTYPIAQIGWRLMRQMAVGVPGAETSVVERMLRFPRGGFIQMKSADNPDGLRGEGLDLVILDEAAFMRSAVWYEVLRPALTEREGKAIFATTPCGRNWVYDLFQAGQLGDGDIASLRFPTADNPFVPLAEIAAAKAGMPQSLFAQEYEAEPDSGDDGVIPLAWVMAAVDRWAGVGKSQAFVLGVDVAAGGADLTCLAPRFGHAVDDLVIVPVPRTGDEADMTPVTEACKAILEEYGGHAVVDALGVGAPVPSALARFGHKVVSFKASKSTKLRDASGTFGFDNVRSAAWWHMREVLRPPSEVSLPKDRMLIAELTAPHFETRAGAKIHVESKDSIRKRIGRSTDRADAVVQAFWLDRVAMRLTVA